MKSAIAWFARNPVAANLLMIVIVVRSVSIAEAISVSISVAFVAAYVFRDAVHDDADHIDA